MFVISRQNLANNFCYLDQWVYHSTLNKFVESSKDLPQNGKLLGAKANTISQNICLYLYYLNHLCKYLEFTTREYPGKKYFYYHFLCCIYDHSILEIGLSRCGPWPNCNTNVCRSQDIHLQRGKRTNQRDLSLNSFVSLCQSIWWESRCFQFRRKQGM